jgi:5-methylcytosine-specific restriction endonuclease McrA
MNPGVLLVPLVPGLYVLGTAFSNPGGLLALCVTRRQRYEHRQRLAHRRWRARPRARQQSSRITKRLRRMVLRADRRRCCYCGVRATEASPLQVDHIVPWVMGGLTCLWNCATLCRSCNAAKSCYWVAPSGKVYYRGGGTPPPEAALILAAELAARRSVRRWLRAYGAGW